PCRYTVIMCIDQYTSIVVWLALRVFPPVLVPIFRSTDIDNDVRAFEVYAQPRGSRADYTSRRGKGQVGGQVAKNVYARFRIARSYRLLFGKNRLNPQQEPIPHLIITVAIVRVVGGRQFL